jgi:hypothetical protein
LKYMKRKEDDLPFSAHSPVSNAGEGQFTTVTGK